MCAFSLSCITKTTKLRIQIFRITALPSFVNQGHQIRFRRVYISIIDRRLKFLMNVPKFWMLWQSLALKEDCTIVGKTFR